MAAQIFTAYVLFVVVGATWRLLPHHGFFPDLLALFAAYLGLTARQKLAPSLLAAVIIGYFADLLFGTPVGLMSLTAGIVCAVCHLLQGRILVRGPLFTMVIAAIVAFCSLAIVSVIRAIVGMPLPGGVGHAVALGSGSIFLTAALGPFVFHLCRLVDARFARTRRDRYAASAGLI